ncbi:MAG: PASTA domain-containing protein [Peptococcaceae bacterium]|nr:PASTA domain-containing protein [Peptococcaceae bacterium]
MCLVCLIAGRLVYLQVIHAPALRVIAAERGLGGGSATLARGSILDSTGYVLAQSVRAKAVKADTKELSEQIAQKKFTESKEDVAAALAEILDLDAADILDLLNIQDKTVTLARQVDLDTAEEISSLRIPGVAFDDEYKRVYPLGREAASVLGVMRDEGHGVEGVEAFYDKELFAGTNVTLTLDATIQYLMDQQADILMTETKAQRVTIVAMDPLSGRVLGMSSRPDFDPNYFKQYLEEERRNTCVSMTYEPGSTFKIITAAAALEDRIVTADELFDDPGYYNVGFRTITNWDSDQKAHGFITLTEGMKTSSNVVLAQVGQKIGKEIFFKYLRAFGFGQKTGMDIAGEEQGLLVPLEQTRELELATMSFGQANLVTPIQMLTAICSIANGGLLYKPYIAEKITSADGRILQEYQPVVVRQVIAQTTAQQVNDILQQVVDSGTGGLAKIPGIKVAGKTGTAQKLDPASGTYSDTDYIASFTAFAPADAPKIAVLAIVDTPLEGSHQGGTLVAPKIKAIIEGALQYYNIPVAGDTPSVIHLPDPLALINAEPIRPVAREVEPERPPIKGESVVPDLTGMTIRKAGESLAQAELHFNFSGFGLAVEQNPVAGKVVPQGTMVEVRFASMMRE